MRYRNEYTVPVFEEKEMDKVLKLEGVQDALLKNYHLSKVNPTAVLVTIHTKKGVYDMDQQSPKKLTKEEKLAISNKLAGSAKLFSYEGLKESDRIANREDWEEDVK